MAIAQVEFGGLDLNDSDQLLFSADTAVPGIGEYRTLLYADIAEGEMRQLSVFPERVLVLGSSRTVQVQNRYGVFRHHGDGFAPVPSFPSFARGNDIRTGKTVAVAASPDGRYLSYLVPVSTSYAELRLYDVEREQETTVSRDIALTLDQPPMRWSPDSRFFVYAKQNQLYYFSLDQYRTERSLSERLRHLGPGTIDGVRWSGENTLFYVRGSLVYRVSGVEFFARSLYQGLLNTGTIVGKIPYSFDPNFDRFWVSPDGAKILVSKDGRSVNVLYLQADDYVSTGETISLPYLSLPRNTRVRTVLWSSEDVITLFTASIRHGESVSSVYRIDLRDPEQRSRFVRTDDEGVVSVSLSPDGVHALVADSDGVSLRRYHTWEESVEYDHPGLLHAAWDGEDAVILAGRETIERVSLADGSRSLLGLSSVEDYGFAPETGAVRAQVGSAVYERQAGTWVATTAADLEVQEAQGANDAYRVYIEELSRGSYHTMVMVRNIESFGTEPLFPRPRRQYEAFPETDDPVDFTNFSHGSRIRRREVSLVFNAIDSVTGLTEILNTLAEYETRATFFLNGDFIRRHPGAVQEIADSGHEVGNLFFTYFDMSSGRFQITRDFIKQGLARNEDEYYEVTGRELSLLWHAPYYFVSPDIVAASQEMNYAYIGRDVDSLDWVPRRDDTGLSRLYKPAAEIVADILEEKQPGSIIGMTVGKPGDDRPAGGREDYLFQRLDVLMNGLIERGYEIVPVSTLMDNAR